MDSETLDMTQMHLLSSNSNGRRSLPRQDARLLVQERIRNFEPLDHSKSDESEKFELSSSRENGSNVDDQPCSEVIDTVLDNSGSTQIMLDPPEFNSSSACSSADWMMSSFSFNFFRSFKSLMSFDYQMSSADSCMALSVASLPSTAQAREESNSMLHSQDNA